MQKNKRPRRAKLLEKQEVCCAMETYRVMVTQKETGKYETKVVSCIYGGKLSNQ